MSYLRVVAQCPATVTEKLAVALTSDDRLFLINKSSVVVQTGPGELFGFGLGQFEEKALGCSQCIMLVMCTGVRVAARAWFLCLGSSISGLARSTQTTCVPWLLATDCKLMVVIERTENGVVKTPRNLAELCQHLTSTNGMPEVTITDHDCRPQTSEEACLLSYV